MTGHQEHAGTEIDVLGNRSLHPGHRGDRPRHGRHVAAHGRQALARPTASTYRSVLEKTILSDGVKVVIADKECGITYHRTELKEERQDRQEARLPPAQDAHERHAGGVRELPRVHQGDRLPRA